MSKILFYWNDILSSNQKKEHFHIAQLAFLWSPKGEGKINGLKENGGHWQNAMWFPPNHDSLVMM